MQLVDSKLHIANMPILPASQRNARTHARLNITRPSQRILALLLAGLIVAVSPSLLSTVLSVISLALQILWEAGHAGYIASQVFGR
jgi:hypothetical protein